MAKILEFRSSEPGCEERTSMGCTRTTAEVIVFPGVRHERHDELGEKEAERAPAPKAGRRRQQRDLLELME